MVQVAPSSVNRHRDPNALLMTSPPAPEQFTHNHSPQWDNSNKDFIPPNQLRKQQQHRPHSPLANYNQVQHSGSPQQQQMGQQLSNLVTSGSPSSPPQARPRPPTANLNTNTGHSRTSSFFSSFRRQSNVLSQSGNNSRTASQAATYTPGTAHLTTSNGGVNEFGGINGSVHHQHQQRPGNGQGERDAIAESPRILI